MSDPDPIQPMRPAERAELIERLDLPEVDSPALILVLDGWIDAGLGATNALSTLLNEITTKSVALFNSDRLLDHRARRPLVHLVDGVNTGLAWPAIELRAGRDLAGNDLLLLIGAEPDHCWRAFARLVTELSVELGVRLTVGLGAYPAPVPHTRQSKLAAAAATPELLHGRDYLRTTLDVPAGVQAAIERNGADVGIPSIGLWSQVPHYAAAMPYPAASLALIEGLASLAQLELPHGSLPQEVAATRTRIDDLISSNGEHEEMVRQLEEQYDEDGLVPLLDLDESQLPSGDEIAAELERYLREHGG